MSSLLIDAIVSRAPQSVLGYLTLFSGALALIVALNVTQQLFAPRENSLPPLVFHFFPWIGSTIAYGKDPYAFLYACRAKYGDVFTFIMLGRKMTVALGTAGTNLVLNGKLANVSAERAYTNFTTPVFGTDVVYDCPNHRLMEQKKFVKFGLSTENFRRYVGMIVEEVRHQLHGDLLKGDGVHDAFKVSSEITICTAAATLQGKEVRESLTKEFAQLYEDLDGGFRAINFAFPTLPIPSNLRRNKAHLAMRHFYLNIINRRREQGASGEPDMLQALEGQAYKDGHELTAKEIAHIMIALLMAGQHTSAASGSWALLHLAEKPELQQEIYDEQVKHYGNPDGSLRPLDYETLQTPLLHATIREVLRLHPPLHALIRLIISDLPVPAAQEANGVPGHDAYVIPKGHFALTAPGVSQMDEALWKDAHVFDPHRWLDNRDAVEDDGAGEKVDFGFGAVSTGAASKYLPFGAGRHRCIGEQFAHLQLATILATIVRESVLSLPSRFPPPDYTTMIVLPQKPREICLRPRKA